MATTTLRIPVDLRDRVAELAERRHTTMLEVVTIAVDRLARDKWWAEVHRELDDLSDADRAVYDAESMRLEGAASDGIDER